VEDKRCRGVSLHGILKRCSLMYIANDAIILTFFVFLLSCVQPLTCTIHAPSICRFVSAITVFIIYTVTRSCIIASGLPTKCFAFCLMLKLLRLLDLIACMTVVIFVLFGGDSILKKKTKSS